MPIHRPSEVSLPEHLVYKLEHHRGGIRHVIHHIQGEFGLQLVYRHDTEQYVIIGPNLEILELAIKTLEKRYMCAKGRIKKVTDNEEAARTASDEQAQSTSSNIEQESSNEKAFVGKLEQRQAVWRFFGDYAKKIGHLFQPEIAALDNITSAHVMLSPPCVEITCSYNDAHAVKQVVEEIEGLIHGLFEREVAIEQDEMVNLEEFLQKQDDMAVMCAINEKKWQMIVYGRTEAALDLAVDAWNRANHPPTPEPIDSPRSSIAEIKNVPNGLRSELKIPGGLVRKMTKRRGGIKVIIDDMEKEFDLRIIHVPRKQCVMYGPNTDILDLAAQTIIHRYVLKAPPENGVVGQLQGKNVVWRFHGTYAKKVNRLLKQELTQLEKTKTVTVKITPSRRNPSLIEILCSHKEIEKVKMGVEKLVGDVHNLHEKHLTIPKTKTEVAIVKEYMKNKYDEEKAVLCLFDECNHQLSVFSRIEECVDKTIEEVQNKLVPNPATIDLPDALCHSFRVLYRKNVEDDILEKIEQLPGGATPAIVRLGKEFGVKTVYRKSKVLTLISASPEVLELAHETLESRYAGMEPVTCREEMKAQNEHETETRDNEHANSSDDSITNQHDSTAHEDH